MTKSTCLVLASFRKLWNCLDCELFRTNVPNESLFINWSKLIFSLSQERSEKLSECIKGDLSFALISTVDVYEGDMWSSMTLPMILFSILGSS